MSFPIYSPQGDGNLPKSIRIDYLFLCVVISYLFPARGRKHGDNRPARDTNGLVISYLFPARGRKQEIGAIDLLIALVGLVISYLFPARGRKQIAHCDVPFADSLHEVISYLFPARGRKQYEPKSPHGLRHGNVISYLFPARGRKRYQGHRTTPRNRTDACCHFLSIPRKGTET
jgi:hypothetical protein